tara:strand:- start:9390 stop:10913 length:1524 start_codon:yes stop_codon:yes gene_type:complete
MAIQTEATASNVTREPDQELTHPETITRIEVTRIHNYALNPRRQANPEYDRIKASIRVEGLDQPLVITQAPGVEDYVLLAGGNTRLRILKELYEESGEERFYRVNCLFKPWVQESSVLFAHLRENELRGSLPFIDKAQAVFEAKRLLEDELEVDELSQRQLETFFKERGFSLSHSMISKMGYAVHTLWPTMPNALSAGLGRPQIERIRALERAARRIWERRELGDVSVYDMIFAELCRRYDDAEWDIQPLRAALENEIAEESEQSLQAIRLEMEACLAGKTFVVVDRPPPEAEVMENQPVPVDETDQSGYDEAPVGENTRVGSPVDTDPESQEPPLITPCSTVSNGSADDVESLRTQALALATRLAERNGLGELVVALPGQGMGFLLCDVPGPDLTEMLDQEMLGQISTLWWQLAACAEITIAPIDILMEYLQPDGVLRQALEAQDAGLLFNSIWTLDPGHTGDQLWWQLSDQDWQDLLGLMNNYRALKRLAMESALPLWVLAGGEA